MSQQVPQPPMQAASRDAEQHRFWPGALVAGCGVVLLCVGALRLTSVPLAGGGAASEADLATAFAHGGLQYAAQLPPPAPPRLDNSATAAEELDRWAQQQANAAPPDWVVRVDPRAATRCPT